MLFDLCGASFGTTSTQMTWTMLLMANHQHIQERVQSELDEVCGSRSPTMDDRSSMPYTQATILEIMRYRTIMPLAVPHTTTTDVTLQGYNIPKGTFIIPHQQMVHENEIDFPDPGKFNPKRFLKNGKFEPHPHLLPYGVGNRKCPGDGWANQCVFLFFTRILQPFKIKPAHGFTKINDEIVYGVSNHPNPFEITLERRRDKMEIE